MAPAKQITFVDIISIVPASWFNRLQEHLAGFLNLKVTVSGAVVTVAAGNDDDVASAYIAGEMRRRDTDVTFTFVAEGADTYDVLVTADSGDDLFALEVVSGTPAATLYRKVAEVDWDTATITDLRGVRGRVIEHDHAGLAADAFEHTDLSGAASGDPHTQYSLVDGTRAFSAPVAGVSPAVAADLATKAYTDGVMLTIPVGGLFYWPTADAVPEGFLLCDGAAVNRTTYAGLFAAIGTAYGAGDESTTFNVPDMRERMALGKSGSSELGDSGGALEHSHSQVLHTHTQDSHSHLGGLHDHVVSTSGSAPGHSHTQGVTGASASHTHTAAAHTHSATGLGVPNVGTAVIGSRTADSGRSGMWPEDDLDGTATDSSSHSHSNGSYETVQFGFDVFGSSASASLPSHTHAPAQNAMEHTHSGGTITGNSASGGSGATGGHSAAHTHTNPTTATSASHTHAGWTTGSATPGTDADGAETSGSSGDDAYSSEPVPYLTMHVIIRA